MKLNMPNLFALSSDELDCHFRNLVGSGIDDDSESDCSQDLIDCDTSSIRSEDKLVEESFLSDMPMLQQNDLSMSVNNIRDLEASFIKTSISRPFNFLMDRVPKIMHFKKDDAKIARHYEESTYNVD